MIWLEAPAPLESFTRWGNVTSPLKKKKPPEKLKAQLWAQQRPLLVPTPRCVLARPSGARREAARLPQIWLQFVLDFTGMMKSTSCPCAG